jgi:hypothetical protein
MQSFCPFLVGQLLYCASHSGSVDTQDYCAPAAMRSWSWCERHLMVDVVCNILGPLLLQVTKGKM